MKTCHAIFELEVACYGANCNIAYVAHFELTKFRARMLRKEEGLWPTKQHLCAHNKVQITIRWGTSPSSIGTTTRRRVISLRNVPRKVGKPSPFSANRLHTILPRWISPLQSAFIPTKDIHDDILVVHEFLSSFAKRCTRKVCMTINLDMEKANDRLNCDFVKKCFTDMGFW